MDDIVSSFFNILVLVRFLLRSVRAIFIVLACCRHGYSVFSDLALALLYCFIHTIVLFDLVLQEGRLA